MALTKTRSRMKADQFDTVADLLAETEGYARFAVSDIIEAGGFRYEVAASGASDQDITTAGGVKLYVKSLGFNAQNRHFRFVAGALRNSGSGWQFISDSEHEPLNAVSVQVVDGINLRVGFNTPNAKVVSAVCSPDEALARMGLNCGASVGLSNMDIRGALPLQFSLTTDGANAPILTAAKEIENRITLSRQGFAIRVNHSPAVLSPPVISRSLGSPDVVVDSLTNTAFNLRQISTSNFYYRVRYASGWQLLTNDSSATLDASSFTADGNLVVTLGTPLLGNDFAFQSKSDRYSEGRIFSAGLSSFTVRFYNAAGAVITTEANGTMETYFQYGPPVQILNNSTTLPAGTYHVSRGNILINWDDLTSPDSYGANSNIWFMAILEVT